MPAPIYLKAKQDEGGPRTLFVDKSPFSIGRHHSADARIDHASVSGLHAQIVAENEHWSLVDKGSTNGTFVNGTRLRAPQRIEPGDLISFGKYLYYEVVSEGTYVRWDSSAFKTTPDMAPHGEIEDAMNYFRVLKKERFFTHFQPIFEIKGGAVAGYEALGRGAGQGRVLPPSVLFRFAARTSGERVLSGAMRRSAVACVTCGHCWPKGEAKTLLFINLHADELSGARFEEVVEEYAASPVPHDYQVVFEIPETWVGQTEELRTFVTHLRSLGALVAYDDFGTGQSRISDLVRNPPDFLKIDRQLVHDMVQSAVQRDLVRAVVEACKKLGTRTIAEGIETEAEVQVSRELGVELTQGYLLGAPTAAHDLFQVPTVTLPTSCPYVEFGLVSDRTQKIDSPG